MANWTFRPPYVLEGPSGGHRLFLFANLRKGITIVKTDGEYYQTRYAVEEDLLTYDEVYRGGYEHTVNDATKAALIAGGVDVTEDNFTAQ